MLRPEQLQLAALGTGDVEGCPAVVTDCDFGGNTCTLTVQLSSAEKRPLLVRSSGMLAPRVGSQVRVSTLGHAHVLG